MAAARALPRLDGLLLSFIHPFWDTRVVASAAAAAEFARAPCALRRLAAGRTLPVKVVEWLATLATVQRLIVAGVEEGGEAAVDAFAGQLLQRVCVGG